MSEHSPVISGEHLLCSKQPEAMMRQDKLEWAKRSCLRCRITFEDFVGHGMHMIRFHHKDLMKERVCNRCHYVQDTRELLKLDDHSFTVPMGTFQYVSTDDLMEELIKWDDAKRNEYFYKKGDKIRQKLRDLDENGEDKFGKLFVNRIVWHYAKWRRQMVIEVKETSNLVVHINDLSVFGAEPAAPNEGRSTIRRTRGIQNKDGCSTLTTGD